MRRKPRNRKRLNLRCLLWRLVRLFVWLWALSAVLVLLLRFVPPITTSYMLKTSLRNGFYSYQWQPYEQISPNMALAAIAAEEQCFPTHKGFDVDEISAALRDAENEASVCGASTLSQQVAKNLFL